MNESMAESSGRLLSDNPKVKQVMHCIDNRLQSTGVLRAEELTGMILFAFSADSPHGTEELDLAERVT